MTLGLAIAGSLIFVGITLGVVAAVWRIYRDEAAVWRIYRDEAVVYPSTVAPRTRDSKIDDRQFRAVK